MRGSPFQSDQLLPILMANIDTLYPSQPGAEPSPCAIDLDAVRRIALRAPMIGDPVNLRSATFLSRVDAVLSHAPVNRLLLLAQALADTARVDPGAADIFRRSDLAPRIREELEARKSGLRAVEAIVAPPSQIRLQGPVQRAGGND